METKTDKNVEVRQGRPHALSMENRQRAALSGVENVINSSDELVNLSTSCGMLSISGKTLKIEKFNVDDGSLVISGEIDSVRYAAAKSPLLKRLFK